MNTQDFEDLPGLRKESRRHEHEPKAHLRGGELGAQICRPILQAGFIKIARPMRGNRKFSGHPDKLTTTTPIAKRKVKRRLSQPVPLHARKSRRMDARLILCASRNLRMPCLFFI